MVDVGHILFQLARILKPQLNIRYRLLVIVMYCICIAEPVLFDAHLRIVCAQWSHHGSVLAIGGQHAENKENSYICFYTPFGSVCFM